MIGPGLADREVVGFFSLPVDAIYPRKRYFSKLHLIFSYKNQVFPGRFFSIQRQNWHDRNPTNVFFFNKFRKQLTIRNWFSFKKIKNLFPGKSFFQETNNYIVLNTFLLASVPRLFLQLKISFFILKNNIWLLARLAQIVAIAF